MKIYNEKTKIFEQFSFEKGQFEPMMRSKVPQGVILGASRGFVQRVLDSLEIFVSDTTLNVRLSEKRFLEVSGKLDSTAEERVLRQACLDNLDTFLYLHKYTSWNVTRVLGNLAVNSPSKMEALVDFFCRKQLQTVLMGSPTAARETQMVACLVRLLKGVRQVSPDLFKSLTQKMRVILTNIGTNPTRKAVYNFCARRDHQVHLFIRLFKSSLGPLIRKKEHQATR